MREALRLIDMTSLLDQAVQEGLGRLSPECLPLLERLCVKKGEDGSEIGKLDVAVLGGGICGLTTAVSLAERGHHVTLFEEKEEISAVSSISISFNLLNRCSA